MKEKKYVLWFLGVSINLKTTSASFELNVFCAVFFQMSWEAGRKELLAIWHSSFINIEEPFPTWVSTREAAPIIAQFTTWSSEAKEQAIPASFFGREEGYMEYIVLRFCMFSLGIIGQRERN